MDITQLIIGTIWTIIIVTIETKFVFPYASNALEEASFLPQCKWGEFNVGGFFIMINL